MKMIEELEKKGCRKEVVKLLLYCIHENIPGSLVNIEMDELKKTLKEMERVGIIAKDYGSDKITIKADIFSKAPKDYTISDVTRREEELREFVTANVHNFRLIFKGKKPGSMGSPKACIEKLVRWMMENPQYTFDDILNTARYYVETRTDYRYMRQADYFIFKRDGNKKEELSDLSAYIEEGKNYYTKKEDEWDRDSLN